MDHQLVTRLLTSTAVVALIAALAQTVAAQSPQAPTVAAGSIAVTRQGTTTVVTQGTDRGIIDWRSFSIGPQETVRFNQPGRSSVTLNRVTGSELSRIDGNLSANGQVWLANPNGVLIGPGGRVDVGALMATTGRVDAGEFLRSGKALIDQIPNDAAVLNAGSITAGGYAALAAAALKNEGVIAARSGTVALGAGKAMTLDFVGDKLISFQVTQPLDQSPKGADSLIGNSGTLSAPGGAVLLSARAAKGVIDSVINLRGQVIATDIKVSGGTVVVGDGGRVEVSGKLDASDPNGKGGTVAVLGEKVGLMDGAVVDASGATGGGVVLVGGDWQGKGAAPNAQVAYVAPSATINVDATASGDGGKAVVWADDSTRFSGTITARGGATAGDGGRVETSGKQGLSVTTSAKVDASARTSGAKPGAWLLDPSSMVIGVGLGGSLAGSAPNWFVNPGVYNSIDPATIVAGLATGDVTLQTSAGVNAGGSPPAGNITFLDGTIAYAGGVARKLTFQADRDIIFQSGTKIDLSGAAHSVILNSGSAATTQGLVDGGIQLTGATIKTTGGSIVMVGGNNGTLAARGSSTTLIGVNLLNTVLDSGAGSITLHGHGNGSGSNVNGVRLDTVSITASGSGAIAVTGVGVGSISDNEGVILIGASILSAVDGNIAINGTGGGGLSSEGFGVASGSVKTTGSGSISITGVGGAGGGGAQDGIAVASGGSVWAAGTGAVSLIGQRGGGNGSANIRVHTAGAQVKTNSGALTLDGSFAGGSGSAGSNPGVSISSTGLIESASGSISITGTGGTDGLSDGISVGAGGTISAVGSGGAISLRGNSGPSAVGISATSGALSTIDGSLIIETDSLISNSSSFTSTSGSTVFRPISPGLSIGVGLGAAGTYQVSPGLLSQVTGNVGVGRPDGTGAITIGTVSRAGSLLVESGPGALSDITVGGPVTLTGVGSSFTAKAGRNIIVSDVIDVSGATGGGIVLNSDRSGAGIGAIRVNAGANLLGGGGAITLGGGVNPMSGYAVGSSGFTEGVRIDGATIDAGSGVITIRGSGRPSSPVPYNHGVAIVTSNLTTSGGVSIDGVGGGLSVSESHGVSIDTSTITATGAAPIAIKGARGTDRDAFNITLGNGVIQTVGGNLTVDGTASGGGSAPTGLGNIGIAIGSMNLLTTNGTISLSGVGGSAGGGNHGLRTGFGGASTITATGSGSIVLKGVAGAGGTGFVDASSAFSVVSGRLIVESDGLSLSGSTFAATNSLGAVALRPASPGVSIGVNGAAGTLPIDATLLSNITGNLEIGRNDLTGTIRVAANTVLDKSTKFIAGAGAIVFEGVIDGSDNTKSLRVAAPTGTVSFAGSVGAATAFASLDVDAGTLSLSGVASVRTAGTQSFAGSVILNGVTNFSTSNSDLIFGAAVNAGSTGGALTAGVGTGTVTLTGGAGATTPLDSLSLGPSKLGGTIWTVGSQGYGVAVLMADTTIKTNDAPVSFAGTVSGPGGLTLQAGTGSVSFSGSVFNPAYLTHSGTGTLVTGGNMQTVGAQIFSGPVRLGTYSEFYTSNGDIAFLGGVNGTTVGGETLAAYPGGSGRVRLPVGAGGTTALASLELYHLLAPSSSYAPAELGGIVRTTGQQRYDALRLLSNTDLVSTGGAPIRFDYSIEGPGGLTLSTGAGQVTLPPIIGWNAPFTVYTPPAYIIESGVGPLSLPALPSFFSRPTTPSMASIPSIPSNTSRPSGPSSPAYQQSLPSPPVTSVEVTTPPIVVRPTLETTPVQDVIIDPPPPPPPVISTETVAVVVSSKPVVVSTEPTQSFIGATVSIVTDQVLNLLTSIPSISPSVRAVSTIRDETSAAVLPALNADSIRAGVLGTASGALLPPTPPVVTVTGAPLTATRTIKVDAADSGGPNGQVIASAGGVSAGSTRSVVPGLLSESDRRARSGDDREPQLAEQASTINDEPLLD